MKKVWTGAVLGTLVLLLVATASNLAGTPTPILGRIATFAIATIPAGIENAADVYNGWYSDVGPQAFADPVFQDRADWLLEEVPGATLSWGALSLANPLAGGPSHTPSFGVFHCGTSHVTIDSRAIARTTEAARITLLQSCGSVTPTNLSLKWYPGYEVRHPGGGNPIGDPWPDHPWKGRKMFHSSAADGTAFPIGAMFETPTARYTKHRFQSKQGTGPFGAGGEWSVAWEQVYAR